MKKILLALLCLPSIALAAQQEITAVPDSPLLPSIGALKDAVNLRLADIDENFDEIYPIIDAGPVYINASAPADTKVVWIDTDQDNAIKAYIGGAWTVVGTAGSAGDDLGSAAYSDVVALWTTCTGYLKSDGTCDTPSGSATYPSAAGVANWGGSAWGTSYTVGAAANNLVQLNASAQLPAVSAALLTNFPTLNQNTTGTAGGLASQYIDWSASSGGASIANKPTLGTAAALDYGTDIGDVVRLGDDGGGNASLPFTLSYTDLTDKPTIPADVGDLTDTTDILGGKLSISAIDDTPVDAETSSPISSNWAYDHVAAADPHTGYLLESALSANGTSLVGAVNYAAMRTLLDLEVGTDFNAYDADLTTWAGITPDSGVGTFIATPSSTNLAAAVTGETGSGALVFGTSPTLTTPDLGTPSAITLTNATGLPSSGLNLTPTAISSTQTLSAANGYYVFTGAYTATLPAVSNGQWKCFQVYGAHAAVIDPNTSDLIILDGTALTDGTAIKSDGTTGNSVCLQYYDTTGWITWGNNGWASE